MFNAMDSDHDGMIDCHKIDLKNLDGKVIDILTPLLLDIEGRHLTVNFSLFLDLIEELLQKLTIKDRYLLIGPKVKEDVKEIENFKKKHTNLNKEHLGQ